MAVTQPAATQTYRSKWCKDYTVSIVIFTIYPKDIVKCLCIRYTGGKASNTEQDGLPSMKRVATLLLVIIMVLGLAGGPVAYGAGEAVTTPPLIITELKIKTGGSTDEFIELTNVSDEAVELGGYALLYFNSAAPADLTHPTKGPIALPNAQLSADTSVVFAKNTAEVPNAQSMGIDPLSDAAGLVQLVAAVVAAPSHRAEQVPLGCPGEH